MAIKKGKLMACEVCGKHVYIQAYRYDTFRFCSRLCKKIMHQKEHHPCYTGGKWMECEQCGKKVYVTPHEQSHFRFCSNVCRGLHNKKENNPVYKGGYVSNGYKFIFENGKAIPEHRRVMELHLGRELLPWPYECVHHINGKTLDNRIENLELTDLSKHTTFHGTKYPVIDNQRKCTLCGEFKPLAEFRRYRRMCRECSNRERREGRIETGREAHAN